MPVAPPTIAITDLPTRHTTGPQKVTMRLEPCRCGCNGTDSWHAATFKRVVRNVEILEWPILQWAEGENLASYAVAKATIRTPWGEEEVHLHAWVRPTGSYSISYWYRASI